MKKTVVNRIHYYTGKVKQEICDTDWRNRKATRSQRLKNYKAAMHRLIEQEKRR
ncbi:hypothetical protein LC085_07635 [Bacillus tianshenii]|uniref:hypothetical protein n=1 Tax=Sutcliffiella tianshenii TaxID=1463404 RepID=UPI001CD39022|nr:hypothetical protein [Bacillus tianshenii]MCA1319783.1 hypothetical protein [Bacillus tianshenii]